MASYQMTLTQVLCTTRSGSLSPFPPPAKHPEGEDEAYGLEERLLLWHLCFWMPVQGLRTASVTRKQEESRPVRDNKYSEHVDVVLSDLP